MSSRYRLLWGDSHTNLHLRAGKDAPAAAPSGGGEAHTNLPKEVAADLKVALAHARRVIDFWPIAYYPYTYELRSGFRVECWRSDEDVDACWRAVCDLAAEHTRDGELVIFPGFEWQGDGRHGDHNVFFFDGRPPILRCRALPELYDEIRRRGLRAMAIPHHTAYRPGVRSKDWSVHDEELSPFAEIFSLHGCSESDEEWIGLRRNWHMGPGVSGGTIEDALDRGIRLGIVASTDAHYGIPAVYGGGLMACYAEGLTRRALWEAFQQRRVYGVTGDRIELDFRVEDAWMGEAIAKAGTVRALVRVRGCDALDRIELLRNNRVIATHCHNGTWSVPDERHRTRWKLRVEAGWGPKPVDIPDAAPREWAGSIGVRHGAILAAEPCWKTAGQFLGDAGGWRCEFTFRTEPAPAHGGVPTEAAIFEIAARPQDELKITLDGKTVTMTLAEAAQRSRIVDFVHEVEDHVRRVHGLDPADLPRVDRTYFLSHKAKIHRAIPAAGFRAELDHTDAEPPRGRNVYRARVFQRNGQVAWSSPVWVDNA